jgi:pilus assembly protein CpaB
MQGTKKRIIIGGACAVLALVGILLGYADAQRQIEEARTEALARYGGEQVEVVVARHDLAAGVQISASDVEMRTWVSALLPDGALRTVDEAVGRIVAVALFADEPIIADKVADAASGIDVPADRCAVTVPVDDVTALGGQLEPGAQVDVYLTSGTIPKLLACDVSVLATSNAGSASSSSSLFSSGSSTKTVSWITLAVEPSSVQELIAAADGDALFLVLPGAAVDTVAADTTSTTSSLVPSTSEGGTHG